MAPAHPLLLAAADDRCCLVCYTCWIRKFLDKKDRARLNAIAADCPCDFMTGFAKSFQLLALESSEDKGQEKQLGGAKLQGAEK